MDPEALRTEVAVIDELLRPIAQRPVDLNDPDWMAKLREGPRPVDEAGVAAEAAAVLDLLLDAYESGGETVREEIRALFRGHQYFSWGVGLPREWETVAGLRRRLVLVSARDQDRDPRDELMTIWSLCNRARELGIDVQPVLEEVAAMSSDVDRYGFGSMRLLIMRGVEEHDLR